VHTALTLHGSAHMSCYTCAYEQGGKIVFKALSGGLY